MFLPTTADELRELRWDSLDVVLVTGDTYIDSPHIGIAVIGRTLLAAGYRVGIIAQPDIRGEADIARLGEPGLFWGVTSGCVDSMVANYTPTGKPRKQDDLTAGGVNSRRPDRAVIVYTNLIRRVFKKTRPIVLGGVEASLRRISHYDYWSDSVRRSILFDAKADALVYGMGEKTVLSLAGRLRNGHEWRNLRGICYIAREPRDGFVELPPHENVQHDTTRFTEMYRAFYANAEPETARGLYQKQDTRCLIHNPPQRSPSQRELDTYHELPYKRDAHPYYSAKGEVRALETVRFAITTHRGCFGQCRFCAIAVHQGRTVQSRSEASLLREARSFEDHPDFKGIIPDCGGPTANMYGMGCRLKNAQEACRREHCLIPSPCRHLVRTHDRQIRLLRNLAALPRVKKVFLGSGIRYDLVLGDSNSGLSYLQQILKHNVSGQLKVAPEHTEPSVLKLMGKPGAASLERFKKAFDAVNAKTGKEQYLTYYFMADHPGCTLEHMQRLRQFVGEKLRLHPEQVQIFTPTPSTYSTLMYWTETHPFTNEPLFVEKTVRGKQRQKNTLIGKAPGRGRTRRRPPQYPKGRKTRRKIPDPPNTPL
ncbi:YgiQ family radical SAM protein [Thermodesulfobacteriota bacterium]